MNDDLKPVRCGCGGKAEVLKFHNDTWLVICDKCRTSSENYRSRDKAIQAWNMAMSGNREGLSRVERMAKVIEINQNPKNHVYKCAKCGQYMHRTSWSTSVKYCSNCGARLEWE